jgi:hypothetical protein
MKQTSRKIDPTTTRRLKISPKNKIKKKKKKKEKNVLILEK